MQYLRSPPHSLKRPKIRCFFENLAVNYFTLTALNSADKFSNKQQILELYRRPRPLSSKFDDFSTIEQSRGLQLLAGASIHANEKKNSDNVYRFNLDKNIHDEVGAAFLAMDII